MKIRKGTKGIIVSFDEDSRSTLFDGARVKVVERRYFPDGVIVEMLDAGPYWTKGWQGEVPLRYFKPNK